MTLVKVSRPRRPGMGRSHWLDPLARRVLQATGQLPATRTPSDPGTGTCGTTHVVRGCEPRQPR